MQKKTALAAAGALVLSVAGGVSVLALTGTPAVAEPGQPTVITQYVDQYGNPIDIANGVRGGPTVIYLPADETPGGQIAYEQPAPAVEGQIAPASGYRDHDEEHEYEEYEEDHEEYEEHQDEHEEDDDD